MPHQVVFVVDDDISVLKGLERLIKSFGYKVETFTSAQEFLQSKKYSLGSPSCLVLDVCMPGLSGMDLQQEFLKNDVSLPIIFITGHGDIPMSVKAMKSGAVDFLPKPFDDEALLAAVRRAIERDVKIKKKQKEIVHTRRLFEKLTPREFEVMRWVITGMLNKQVALKLGTTEKTIKVHRGRVMQKMQVRSVAELLRLAQKCEITPPKK